MSDVPPGPTLDEVNAPWSRLQRQGVAVGFKRSVGQTELFSQDGYAWSGRPIDFDRALRETGLRDMASQRIFHGDLVRLRFGPMSPQRDMVVLLDASRRVFLADPNEGTLRPMAELVTEQRPYIATIHGSVFNRSANGAPHVARFRRFGMCTEHAHGEGALLALSIFASTLVAGGLQLGLTGGAGPLIGMLGATIGCLTFMVLRRRKRSGWLTRARTLSIVPWAALYLGLGTLVARGLAGAGTGDETLIASMLGLGILGALVGLVLPMVVGDAMGFSPDD